MALEIDCRECNTRLRIREEDREKTIRCPTCSSIVPPEDLTPGSEAASPFSAVSSGPDEPEAVNPYASPTTPVDMAAGPASDGTSGSTHGVRLAMEQTRPWVLFLGILGFIATGIFALVALAGFVMVFVDNGPMGLMVCLVYGIIGVIYFAGSYYLFVYGQRIGKFLETDRMSELAHALTAQKSFWRLLGILAVLWIGLVVLLMGVSVFGVIG